jgi:cytosine deaminase
MCTGAAIFFRLARVVIAESDTYTGGDEYMRSKGIEVTVVGDKQCKDMLQTYIKEHPHIW